MMKRLFTSHAFTLAVYASWDAKLATFRKNSIVALVEISGTNATIGVTLFVGLLGGRLLVDLLADA